MHHYVQLWPDLILITTSSHCLFCFKFFWVVICLCFERRFHCVAKTGLELSTLLSQPIVCWDYRYILPHLAKSGLFFKKLNKNFQKQCAEGLCSSDNRGRKIKQWRNGITLPFLHWFLVVLVSELRCVCWLGSTRSTLWNHFCKLAEAGNATT
jgi:hypothetical protein